MKPASRWPLVRPWAGALLTLLALVWLAPTPTRAGCVHDALRQVQGSAGTAHFRWLIATGAMTTPVGDSTPAPLPFGSDVPGQPRPCDGPSCSGQNGLPPVPPASIAPATGSWAWVGWSATVSGSGSTLLPHPEAQHHSVRRGPAIFHPPRLSFA